MKKASYFAVLMAVVLSVQIVSAISTSVKDSYLPGETMITEVSGSILEPIGSANVVFLKSGHISVPLDYELKKLGENYYLWAVVPETAMNYTLRISDITTYVSGSIQKVTYEKNFSVTGNLTDYSIRPGAIVTDGNFEVGLRVNGDEEMSVDVKFIDKTNLTMKPGENIIKFSASGINESGMFNVSIGKYNIPTYVRLNKTSTSTSNGNATLNLTNLTEVSADLSEPEKEAINEERTKYHCYEFPGKICEAGQVCSGDDIVSADGNCCIHGDCGAPVSSGGSSAWIGYLIAAIVIIVGVFIWMKYKGVKTEKNPIKKIVDLEKQVP